MPGILAGARKQEREGKVVKATRGGVKPARAFEFGFNEGRFVVGLSP